MRKLHMVTIYVLEVIKFKSVLTPKKNLPSIFLFSEQSMQLGLWESSHRLRTDGGKLR